MLLRLAHDLHYYSTDAALGETKEKLRSSLDHEVYLKGELDAAKEDFAHLQAKLEADEESEEEKLTTAEDTRKYLMTPIEMR